MTACEFSDVIYAYGNLSKNIVGGDQTENLLKSHSLTISFKLLAITDDDSFDIKVQRFFFILFRRVFALL